MSKAIRASALVLLLTCSAQAGWIQNDSPAPPPSQPVTVAQEPTTDGIMPNGASDDEIQNDAAITFVQVVMNLLALA